MKDNYKLLEQQNLLLKSINSIQNNFISINDFKTLSDNILKLLLELTDSDYGFIGKTLKDKQGNTYLKTYAITNIAWDKKTKEFYKQNAPNGLEFKGLDNLYGACIETKALVISNNPSNDERSGGLPHGHPDLNSFLGIPLLFEGEMIGMAGVANKPNGYTKELYDFILPFISTVGNIINSYESNIKNKQIESELIESKKREYESEIKYKTLVEGSLDSIFIMQKGEIKYANKELVRLSKYTMEELIGKPFLTFVAPEEVNKVFTIYQKILTKENAPMKFSSIAVAKGGRKIQVEVSVNAIDYLGEEAMMVVLRDMTKQVHFEMELQKSKKEAEENEKRYKNFISKVSEGIYRLELNKPMPIDLPVEEQIDYLYRHSYIAECNDSFVKMYGLKHGNEILGKSQLQIHGGCANPKNREAIRLFIESGYNSEGNESEEPDENGAIKTYLNSSIGIVEDGYLIRQWGTQRDVTALKKSEQELIKLSSAVEQSPASIIITDLDGKIEYVNQKFVEVTGYSFEEAIGNNPKILKSGEKPSEEYKKLWDTIKKGESWTGEFHNKRKNGELFWEQASISPVVNEKGEAKFFLAIKEDITEKKRMTQMLMEALEKAQESDRLKSAFLANLSHEIRTPMNGILGFTDLLSEPGLGGDKQKKFIKIIQKSGDRLLKTMDDIIDISKIESDQVNIYNSKFDLNKEINLLYQRFEPKVIEGGIELNFINNLPENSTLITTDKNKLLSVIINIINNAFKFTQKGIVEFTCQLNGVKENPELLFCVKDTGIGIPKNRQEAIFNMFVKADIEDLNVFEGSGLGLAISKKYISMLGGKIWVESEEGDGSSFYFTIPAIFENDLKENINIKTNNKESHKGVKKLKILIADDDELSASLLSLFVKDLSNEILLAASGEAAIKLAGEHLDIDLVLMDIKMPFIDGIEATRQIRNFNEKVIIIAQTAFAFESEIQKAISAGCNDYITKPILNKDLQGLIKKYFNI